MFNETCSEVHIGENLSDVFLIHNGQKQEGALLSMFFIFALQYAIRNVGKKEK
jgi:hypothetical protein